MFHHFIPRNLVLTALLLLLAFFGRAQVTEIFLEGTRDTEAYEGDTVTVPVMVNTTGLSGENILAFRLEFNLSSTLEVLSFSTENSLIDGWSFNTNPGNNEFIFSAAGITPIAQDSGVLFYMTSVLTEVSSNTTGSYYLKSNGDNYFNEGGYGVTMEGSKWGQVSILDIPSLSVSVSGSQFVRGDSTTVSAFSGTEPYTFSTSDDQVAEILPSGYLGLINVGNVRVLVEDSVGLRGESSELEVLGYRLTNQWSEGTVYPGDTIEAHFLTSTLENLDILSGELTFNIYGAQLISVDADDTCLLASADIQYQYDSINRSCELAFASIQSIDGDGSLFKLRLVVDAAVSSVSISGVQVLFNESLQGAYVHSSLSVDQLPTISVSATTSVPNPLLPGDTIPYTADNGSSPYTWSSSDESVAALDQNGNLVPLGAGLVSARAADANGIIGTSSELRVYDGTLTVASEVAVYNSEHLLPFSISELPAGKEVLAYEMRVDIDTSKIAFVSVETGETLSEDFSLVVNAADSNRIKVVGASQVAVQGGDVLFYLKIKLKESFTSGNTYIYPRNVIFNEGSPELFIENGRLTPGDPPPVAGASLIAVEEDVSREFGATDFAYSQENSKPMAWVRILSLPERGTLTYHGKAVMAGAEIAERNLASLTYTPPADDFGDSLSFFQVKVGDADSYSNNDGTVTISVASINDAPRFSLSQDTLLLDEDFEGTYMLSVSEEYPLHEEAEDYTYAIDSSGNWSSIVTASVDSTSGTLTVASLAEANGEAWIKLTASDGQSENATAKDSVLVMVNPVNDLPTAQDQQFSVNENSIPQTVIDTLVAQDVDGDALIYTIVSGNEAGFFDLDSTTGVLYTSEEVALDFETKSAYILGVRISDGMDSVTIELTVTLIDLDEPVNLPPVISDQSFSIEENAMIGQVIDTLKAFDQDSPKLTYAVLSGNDANLVSLSSEGVLTVANTCDFDFESVPIISLMVRVSDSISTAAATVTITLTDIEETPVTVDVTVCSGQSYIFGSLTLTVAGSYTEVFQSTSGCDSTVTLNLSTTSEFNETASVSICEGETYTFGSQTLNTAGTFTEAFQAVGGCDSTVSLTLDVLSPIETTQTATVCNGDVYSFGSQILTRDGVYTEVFQSVNGCDSTVVLTLSVNPAIDIATNVSICTGSSYLFGSQTLTASGTYTETFQSIAGCDSMVTLSLAVISAFNETATVSLCEGEQYVFGSQTLTDAGLFTEVFQAVGGCDSTVVLTLSFSSAVESRQTAAICEGDSFVFGTQTLAQAGSYTEIFQSSSGCDSTVILGLSTISGFDEQVTASICAGERFDFGAQSLAVAGTYVEIFSSTTGCDSTVTLTLSLNEGNVCDVLANNDIGKSASELKVFPNPVGEHLHVEFPEITSGKLEIKDLSGRLLQTFQVFSESSMDMRFDFPPGMYLLDLMSEQEGLISSVRIIKP